MEIRRQEDYGKRGGYIWCDGDRRVDRRWIKPQKSLVYRIRPTAAALAHGWLDGYNSSIYKKMMEIIRQEDDGKRGGYIQCDGETRVDSR